MKILSISFLLLLTIQVSAQVSDQIVNKYLTGRDWVVIALKESDEMEYDEYEDLGYFRFQKGNTGIINYVAEAEDEDIAFEWEYSDGYLSIVDDESEYFDDELSGRIEYMDSTRFTFKVLDPEIMYIYFQERKNLKATDISLYEKAVESKTRAAYENYLNTMPYGKYVENIEALLSEYEWASVKNSNDIELLQEFCDKFEDSDYYGDAQSLIDELRWQKCQKLATMEAYAEYINNSSAYYSKHLTEAYAKYEEFLWVKAKNANTAEYYNEYLRIYPSGKYSGEAKDHQKFFEAKATNSMGSYSGYLSSYPYGKHVSEVNDILINAYLYWANKSFQSFLDAKGAVIAEGETSLNATLSGHIDEALKYYTRLIDEYPSDSRTQQTKKGNYADACYYKAELLFVAHDYDAAIQYYDKYLYANPGGSFSSDANLKKVKAAKVIRKQNLPDLQYFQYNATVRSPLGFAYGYANTWNMGAFFSVKMNPGIIHGNSYYTYDGHNFVGNVFEPRPTGKEIKGSISLSAGASVLLSYPVSAWVSLGYYYENVIMEVDEYDEYGEFYETKWIRDESRTLGGIESGLGLMLNSRDISLCLGVTLVNMETATLNFGIGWTF